MFLIALPVRVGVWGGGEGLGKHSSQLRMDLEPGHLIPSLPFIMCLTSSKERANNSCAFLEPYITKECRRPLVTGGKRENFQRTNRTKPVSLKKNLAALHVVKGGEEASYRSLTPETKIEKKWRNSNGCLEMILYQCTHVILLDVTSLLLW